MNKVSIIVPVYNAENSIRKCIDSIINQSYKNIELLLINDGSIDKSLEIIKEYEKKNNRIIVIDKKNAGVSQTRNLGIKEATGNYIMFIDNDDFIDEDYIENYVSLVKDNNYDVVIGGYRRVNIYNKILKTQKLRNTEWSKYIVMAPWAKLYKRSFLIENKINFFEYGIGEDVYFNLSLFANKPNVLITQYIGYNWFFNSKSVSNTSQKGLSKDIDILILLNKIISLNNNNEFTKYYLKRYFIWYLLFSGKKASKKDFVKEYKRVKEWFNNNKIKSNINPFSKKISGESLINRLIVFIFGIIEKLNLVKFFATLYCKETKKIKHCFVVLAYKESPYLEECIKSVTNQKYNSKVVIATSTPNQFITNLANKYDLEIIVNNNPKGIGSDFDFALFAIESDLVTIAHQDDIYNYDYSYEVVNKYSKNNKSIILFTDYYEIKNDKDVYSNINLKMKRILLFPLRFKLLNHIKFFKRRSLSLGCSICCPSVTFVKKRVSTPLFDYNFKCDIDWHAWETLSKKKGNFSFVNKFLMGHRVHEDSTTTEIIKENIRTKEDLIMFKRFWPDKIAKKINKLYSNSEKSNNV